MHPTSFAVRTVLAAVAATSLTHLTAITEEAAGDCIGLKFDSKQPSVISKMSSAAPRTYFTKSAFQDDACPSQAAACQAKAYLVPGDLVLGGKKTGAP